MAKTPNLDLPSFTPKPMRIGFFSMSIKINAMPISCPSDSRGTLPVIPHRTVLLVFRIFDYMSREEVKTAINQLLDKTPEHVLQEVYDYLQSVQGKPEESSMAQNLRTILSEDKELLKRLAQ